jgi:hypothetical protein
MRYACIDLVLEPRDKFRGSLAIRASDASRRHQPTPQLADHFLGNLGALVDVIQIQRRQCQATRFDPVAVTGQAILVDEGTV